MKALALVGIMASYQLFAQTASFEVASVKVVPTSNRLPDGFTLNPRRSGARITWTTTLSFLSRYAYHLPEWRISGIANERSFYAIAATMDSSAKEDEVRLMFQKLLADRFHLVAHRETKELQGYALVVAKNGPKIRAAAPGDAPPMPEYFKDKSPAAFESRMTISSEGPSSALTGRGVSTAQLAEALSDTLGAFVRDQTGLTGSYYFGFKFAPVNSTADNVESPPIFAVLQDELGLKLEKQKGPVEFLVVDHVEKIPTEN